MFKGIFEILGVVIVSECYGQTITLLHTGLNGLLTEIMEQVYVSCTSLDENKRQKGSAQPETTQDKLIISNERPWKPWQPARSRIRGCAMRVQRAMLSLAGLEWYCYAALGVLTALMSFWIDLTVAKLLRGELACNSDFISWAKGLQ
ncbi:hypothetical protein AOLI_G00162870 [Acnodon oligacanthus]